MSYKYFGRLAGSTEAVKALKLTAEPSVKTPFNPMATSTKFLSYGENATSLAFNRALGALSANTDAIAGVLDAPCLRRDILLPKATDGTNEAGYSSLSKVVDSSNQTIADSTINLGKYDVGVNPNIVNPPQWIFVGLHAEKLSNFVKFYRSSEGVKLGDSKAANVTRLAPIDVYLNSAEQIAARSYYSTQTYSNPGSEAINDLASASRIPPIEEIITDLPPYQGAIKTFAVSKWEADGAWVGSDEGGGAVLLRDYYLRPGCYVHVYNDGPNAGSVALGNNGLFRIAALPGNRHVTYGEKLVLTRGGLHKVTIKDEETGNADALAAGELVTWREEPNGTVLGVDADYVFKAYVMFISGRPDIGSEYKDIYLATFSGAEDFPLYDPNVGTGSPLKVSNAATQPASIGLNDLGLLDQEYGGDSNWSLGPDTLLLKRLTGGGFHAVSVHTDPHRPDDTGVIPASYPVSFNTGSALGYMRPCSPPGFILNPVVRFTDGEFISGDYSVDCFTLTTVREKLLSSGLSADRYTLEDPSSSLSKAPLEEIATDNFISSLKVGDQTTALSGAIGWTTTLGEVSGAAWSQTLSINSTVTAPARVLGNSLWRIEVTSALDLNGLMSVEDVLIFNSNPSWTNWQTGNSLQNEMIGRSYAVVVAIDSVDPSGANANTWILVLKNVFSHVDFEQESNGDPIVQGMDIRAVVSSENSLVTSYDADAITVTAMVEVPYLERWTLEEGQAVEKTLYVPGIGLGAAYNDDYSAFPSQRRMGYGNQIRTHEDRPVTVLLTRAPNQSGLRVHSSTWHSQTQVYTDEQTQNNTSNLTELISLRGREGGSFGVGDIGANCLLALGLAKVQRTYTGQVGPASHPLAVLQAQHKRLLLQTGYKEPGIGTVQTGYKTYGYIEFDSEGLKFGDVNTHFAHDPSYGDTGAGAVGPGNVDKFKFHMDATAVPLTTLHFPTGGAADSFTAIRVPKSYQMQSILGALYGAKMGGDTSTDLDPNGTGNEWHYLTKGTQDIPGSVSNQFPGYNYPQIFGLTSTTIVHGGKCKEHANHASKLVIEPASYFYQGALWEIPGAELDLSNSPSPAAGPFYVFYNFDVKLYQYAYANGAFTALGDPNTCIIARADTALVDQVIYVTYVYDVRIFAKNIDKKLEFTVGTWFDAATQQDSQFVDGVGHANAHFPNLRKAFEVIAELERINLLRSMAETSEGLDTSGKTGLESNIGNFDEVITERYVLRIIANTREDRGSGTLDGTDVSGYTPGGSGHGSLVFPCDGITIKGTLPPHTGGTTYDLQGELNSPLAMQQNDGHDPLTTRPAAPYVNWSFRSDLFNFDGRAGIRIEDVAFRWDNHYDSLNAGPNNISGLIDNNTFHPTYKNCVGADVELPQVVLFNNEVSEVALGYDPSTGANPALNVGSHVTTRYRYPGDITIKNVHLTNGSGFLWFDSVVAPPYRNITIEDCSATNVTDLGVRIQGHMGKIYEDDVVEDGFGPTDRSALSSGSPHEQVIIKGCTFTQYGSQVAFNPIDGNPDKLRYTWACKSPEFGDAIYVSCTKKVIIKNNKITAEHHWEQLLNSNGTPIEVELKNVSQGVNGSELKLAGGGNADILECTRLFNRGQDNLDDYYDPTAHGLALGDRSISRMIGLSTFTLDDPNKPRTLQESGGFAKLAAHVQNLGQTFLRFEENSTHPDHPIINVTAENALAPWHLPLYLGTVNFWKNGIVVSHRPSAIAPFFGAGSAANADFYIRKAWYQQKLEYSQDVEISGNTIDYVLRKGIEVLGTSTRVENNLLSKFIASVYKGQNGEYLLGDATTNQVPDVTDPAYPNITYLPSMEGRTEKAAIHVQTMHGFANVTGNLFHRTFATEHDHNFTDWSGAIGLNQNIAANESMLGFEHEHTTHPTGLTHSSTPVVRTVGTQAAVNLFYANDASGATHSVGEFPWRSTRGIVVETASRKSHAIGVSSHIIKEHSASMLIDRNTGFPILSVGHRSRVTNNVTHSGDIEVYGTSNTVSLNNLGSAPYGVLAPLEARSGNLHGAAVALPKVGTGGGSVVPANHCIVTHNSLVGAVGGTSGFIGISLSSGQGMGPSGFDVPTSWVSYNLPKVATRADVQTFVMGPSQNRLFAIRGGADAEGRFSTVMDPHEAPINSAAAGNGLLAHEIVDHWHSPGNLLNVTLTAASITYANSHPNSHATLYLTGDTSDGEIGPGPAQNPNNPLPKTNVFLPGILQGWDRIRIAPWYNPDNVPRAFSSWTSPTTCLGGVEATDPSETGKSGTHSTLLVEGLSPPVGTVHPFGADFQLYVGGPPGAPVLGVWFPSIWSYGNSFSTGHAVGGGACNMARDNRDFYFSNYASEGGVDHDTPFPFSKYFTSNITNFRGHVHVGGAGGWDAAQNWNNSNENATQAPTFGAMHALEYQTSPNHNMDPWMPHTFVERRPFWNIIHPSEYLHGHRTDHEDDIIAQGDQSEFLNMDDVDGTFVGMGASTYNDLQVYTTTLKPRISKSFLGTTQEVIPLLKKIRMNFKFVLKPTYNRQILESNGGLDNFESWANRAWPHDLSGAANGYKKPLFIEAGGSYANAGDAWPPESIDPNNAAHLPIEPSGYIYPSDWGSEVGFHGNAKPGFGVRAFIRKPTGELIEVGQFMLHNMHEDLVDGVAGVAPNALINNASPGKSGAYLNHLPCVEGGFGNAPDGSMNGRKSIKGGVPPNLRWAVDNDLTSDRSPKIARKADGYDESNYAVRHFAHHMYYDNVTNPGPNANPPGDGMRKPIVDPGGTGATNNYPNPLTAGKDSCTYPDFEWAGFYGYADILGPLAPLFISSGPNSPDGYTNDGFVEVPFSMRLFEHTALGFDDTAVIDRHVDPDDEIEFWWYHWWPNGLSQWCDFRIHSLSLEFEPGLRDRTLPIAGQDAYGPHSPGWEDPPDDS
jgi:hypothetical protein